MREEALLTIPPGYLKDSELKEVGVILAHGNDADEWRGKLLTELAVALAKQGMLSRPIFISLRLPNIILV